jgi:hypothetical protein
VRRHVALRNADVVEARRRDDDALVRNGFIVREYRSPWGDGEKEE